MQNNNSKKTIENNNLKSIQSNNNITSMQFLKKAIILVAIKIYSYNSNEKNKSI